MLVLLLVAFISGLLTIFAPCIWPILPVVLSSSVGGRRQPLGVTLGILLSFSLLTLSLSYLVRSFNLDPNFLRLLAVIVIGFLGLSLIIPVISNWLEGLVSRLTGLVGLRRFQNTGFWPGFFTGLALGVVWSPCAGPVLATIAALSATRAVNSQVILLTAVYMFGTGLPLFIFATFGQRLLVRSRVLSKYAGLFQQFLGVLLLVTALLIWSNYDKLIQAKLLNLFPGFSSSLYRLEQITPVQNQLNQLQGKPLTAKVAPSAFLPDYGPAKEIIGIDHWLNSSPLSISSLRGKVVMVDFWTYSCINCLRTLPFVTGWYEKYKNSGLVVIGVHTPEFEFEKNTHNVENALKMYGVTYPVAQDNNYATWNNYGNSYWPAKYLIDKNGHLRLMHDGEGNYAETEKAIQALIAETGQPMSDSLLNLPEQTPTEVLTPETYLGSNRGDAGSGIYTLQGDWLTQAEYLESKPGTSLSLNFSASEVYLVITPTSPIDKIVVYLDDTKITNAFAGKDVRDGQVVLDGARLYHLIDLHDRPGRHVLRLDFGTKGTKVFAFTFG